MVDIQIEQQSQTIHTNAPDPIYTDPAHKALVDALNISFRILQVTMLIIIVGFLCSGIFVVRQHETALVLRFGKIIGTPADRILNPGLHWAWPYPISTIVRIPTGRIQSVKINDFWYFESASNSSESTPLHNHTHINKNHVWKSLRPGIDGYLICGDANIIHAKFVMRYQITDPYTYYTTVSNVDNLVRTVVLNSLTKNAGRQSVDTLLRTGIEAFRTQVEHDAQTELAKINSGICFQHLDIVRLIPPRQVKKSFDDVALAEQQYSQKINEARGFATRLQNESVGAESKILSQAQAYKTNLIEQAKADANYLLEILDTYTSNPAMVSFLMYQNFLTDTIPNIDDKFIFNRNDNSSNRQIRILLNKNPKPIR